MIFCFPRFIVGMVLTMRLLLPLEHLSAIFLYFTGEGAEKLRARGLPLETVKLTSLIEPL